MNGKKAQNKRGQESVRASRASTNDSGIEYGVCGVTDYLRAFVWSSGVDVCGANRPGVLDDLLHELIRQPLHRSCTGAESRLRW